MGSTHHTIDRSAVRAFLGIVGITRRWVKNFTEITKPLFRLIGKIDWKWGMAEQLFFEIFKIKCASRTSMHGMDYQLFLHFYTDVSGFGVGLVIIQFQMPSTVNLMAKGPVEMPIIMIFSHCNRHDGNTQFTSGSYMQSLFSPRNMITCANTHII